jgi:uncharacterized protein (DUF2236 family)
MSGRHARGDVMNRVVQPDDLEQDLAHVRALAAGEGAGLFGPGSFSWRVCRESAVFLAGGRALLLQLAHPWVAAGVAKHSSTLADPIGRFHRTFAIMFTLVFGSLEQAIAAARRLNRRHASVHGTLPWAAGRFAQGSSYAANEASALRWVHATLVESALISHDLVLPPLTAAERERYYGESRLMAAMFGLRSEDLPPTWEAFRIDTSAQWKSGDVAVTPAARRMAEQVLAGGASRLRPPGWYRALTVRLLPEEACRGFDLPIRDRDRRLCDRMLLVLRRIYPAAPARLRTVGPYQEAMARVSRGAGPDLLTRGLNRLWIGQPAMPDAAPAVGTRRAVG